MENIQRASAVRSRSAPGPSGWSQAFGSLRAVGKDPLRFFTELTQTHGDIVQVRFPRLLMHVVSHPDLVRHVLQERQQIYRKGLEYELMKPLLGDGLLTSDGALWKRQRRLAQPAFHREKLSAFADLMVTRAGALADRWQREPGPTDLHADLMQLTLMVVGEALFGAELTEDGAKVGPALTEVLRLFAHRNRSLWLLVPLWVPIPSHQRFFRNREILNGVVDRVIAARRAEGNAGRSDLLSMLMEARDEVGTEPSPRPLVNANTVPAPQQDSAGVARAPGATPLSIAQRRGEGTRGRAGGTPFNQAPPPAMSDLQLRDECMTMLLAGHETTANLLTWTLVLLARHPDIADRLREVIDSVLHGAPPTLEDLPKLGEVERVLKESLRLYPPAWAISRILNEDDELRGFQLPAGSQVLISQYVIQRLPDLWPDPERFDPDRFLEAAEKQRPRFAYFPFGGGPRQCIGKLFAMMEAQLMLVVLLQRSRIEIDPARRIVAEPSITLRPLHGLPATVGARVAHH